MRNFLLSVSALSLLHAPALASEALQARAEVNWRYGQERSILMSEFWVPFAQVPDTDTPDIGIAPQIYYGAPINDGLVGHWTFDTEWTTNTTAYDRSGQGNDGTLNNGLVPRRSRYGTK